MRITQTPRAKPSAFVFVLQRIVLCQSHLAALLVALALVGI